MQSNIPTLVAAHFERVPCPIVACGAYLKNRACLIDRQTIRWSQLHGDLNTVDACRALNKTIHSWCVEQHLHIGALACDFHPDFYSSRIATTTAEKLGVPSLAVQHHHAHIAGVIAEHGIEQKVIGVALDGMGLGIDNALWGGELLLVEGGINAHQWRRVAHLDPIALPGGERAAREPWRLAAAILHESGDADLITHRFAPLVGASATEVVKSMLQKQLNCPPSSSCGRWFDAAAGALGVSIRQTHEAQAAITLEQLADEYLREYPQFDWPWQSLNFSPVVRHLFDMQSQIQGAALFHLALVNGLSEAIKAQAREYQCKDVVLSGGCFANRILTTRLGHTLQVAGLRVHTPADRCYGDDGLALGQAWIAACQMLEAKEQHPPSVVVPC